MRHWWISQVDGCGYLPFLAAAQRFFCAAAILALASSLNVRFLADVTGTAVAIFLGRPGPRFTVGVVASVSIARACWSLLISWSIEERIASRFIR